MRERALKREMDIEPIFYDSFYVCADPRQATKVGVSAEQILRRLFIGGYEGTVKSVYQWLQEHFEGHESVKLIHPKGRTMWRGLLEKEKEEGKCPRCGQELSGQVH